MEQRRGWRCSRRGAQAVVRVLASKDDRRQARCWGGARTSVSTGCSVQNGGEALTLLSRCPLSGGLRRCFCGAAEILR